MEEQEQRAEEYRTEDAEIILIGYGIISRILQTAVDNLREEGVKVGMLRPITLFPFPTKSITKLAKSAKFFLTVEMSNGQLVDDIRLKVEGKIPVYLYNRMGGNVPSIKEIHDEVMKLMRLS